MLKSEETKAFLDKAQRLSADWTVQAQFIRDEFLPQLEALNQHIAQRSHVPDLSRDVLTSYMRESDVIAPYIPRIAHISYSNGNCCNTSALTHGQINSESLISVLFPDDVLALSLGSQHDFALYFDRKYKDILIGIPSKTSAWENYGVPARIYTNYDFYVDMEVKVGQPIQRNSCYSGNQFECHTGFCELTTSSPTGPPSVKPVPLSGCQLNRQHISLSFYSVSSIPTPALLDPTPAVLTAFLAQRKQHTHPLVVLDYVRQQSLMDVSAFFGDVSQYDLAEAKDALHAEKAAHSRTMAELGAQKQAGLAAAMHLRGVVETNQSQAQELQQQRSKQNDAALRIRRLETKLAQSERLYEDLLTQESLKSHSDLELQLGRLMGDSRALDTVTLEECEHLKTTLTHALEKVNDKAAKIRERQNDREDQRLCAVCQVHPKSVVVLPCRHLCLCSGCSAHHLMLLCPLCREPIVDKISVFA